MIDLKVKRIDSSVSNALTWREIEWGLRNGYIGWDQVRELARQKVGDSSGPDVFKLNWSESITESEDALIGLADQDKPQSEADIQRRWLYLILQDIYSRREEFNDALDVVEQVYSDFGYPEDIEGFVKYMPPTDGYNPAKNSYEDNRSRLFEKWRSWLEKFE